MLSTGMNYGLGTNSTFTNAANTNAYANTNTSTNANDILTTAYSNPMTTCSAAGSINVNGVTMPTNYDNDFFMPQELKIGNYLNGQIPMQGGATPQTQVGDQFVPSQTPEQTQQMQQMQQNPQTYPSQEIATQAPQNTDPNTAPASFSLKKKGAIAGFLAPVAMGAYKMLKGAAPSSVFNKDLLIKCPLLAVAGLVLGSLADNFLSKKVAA